MKTLSLSILLFVSTLVQGQPFFGYCPTTSNPIIVYHVNVGNFNFESLHDFGLYAKVRWGDIYQYHTGVTEFHYGFGIMYETEVDKSRVGIGINYQEYHIGDVTYTDFFDPDPIKDISLDVAILVKIPPTERWYLFINNDMLNWVLEVAIGFQF